MSYLDKYVNRDTMYGEGVREVRINNQKRKLSSTFSDSPNYYQVELDGALIDAQIVDESETRDEKTFTSLYETPVSLGDVVGWKYENWLVIHFDEMSEIYKRGRIRKCLGTLKWLNQDGFEREVDFTLSSPSATNFGVQDGQIIDLGNERRQLIIPSNVDSKKIKKNKRFIIDERAWKVTAVDRTTKGLIYLTLTEDEISANDNVDLEIAEWFATIHAITIIGGNILSINAGSTRQLSTEITLNGNIVTGLPIQWSSSNPSVASVNSNGMLTTIANGSAIISASLLDKPSVSDTINVTVQLSTSNNVSVTINGADTITVGNTAHYTVTVTNNGVVDNAKQVQWYLYDTDLSSTELAEFTNNQFTQCDVKSKSVGNIKLKAVVIGYSSSTYTKNIAIKHLF